MQRRRPRSLWNTNAIDFPGVEAAPLRFRVHNCQVMKIKGALTLPDNSNIVVCWEYYSGSLLVFSLQTNTLTFTIPIHSLPPLAVAPLGRQLVLCSNADKTLSVVDVCAGVRISKVTVTHNVKCIATLDSQRFVTVHASNVDTMRAVFHNQGGTGWEIRKPSFEKVESKTLQENVVLATVYGQCIAILTVSKLIVWDAAASKQIVSCPADTNVEELVMNERFIVCASSEKSKYVSVRHTHNLQLVRQYEPLQGTFSNFSILGSILMTSFYRRLSRTKLSRNHEILFSSLETGEMLYKMVLSQSNSSASRISSPCFFLPNGRVITAFRSKSWLLCITVPEMLMQHRNPLSVVADQDSAEGEDQKPLQTAFLSYLNGNTTAKDMCLNMISYDLCKASVTEWFCAHRILMLAVHSRQIESSPDYGNRYGFWFETVYLAAKDILICSDLDFNVIRKALREAVLCRVIRSEEPIIAAIHITRDIRQSKTEIFTLGQELLSRIFQIERSNNHFSTALQNYVAFQSNANLFSAALNMIPFIGGTIASAISAGSRIFEDCALSSHAELAIDIGTEAALGFKSFEEKVLLAAAEGLKPKNVQGMSDDLRSVLELSLEKSGVNREQLRAVFLAEGEKQLEATLPLPAGSFQTNPGGTETLNGGGECAISGNPISGIEHLQQKGGHSSESKSKATTQQCTSNQYSTTTEAIVIDEHSIETIDLRHIEKIGLQAQSIEKLDAKVMAAILAAHTVGFNERRREKYNQLRGYFLTVFLDQDIDGSVFTNREYFPVDQLVNVILNGLRSMDPSSITFGIEGKIRLYICSIG